MAAMDRKVATDFGSVSLHKWLEGRLRVSGMSQKRLASLLDVDPPQLNRILRGVEAVSDRLLMHACRIFGLDDDETAVLIAHASVCHAQSDYIAMTERACKRYPQEQLHRLLSHIQHALFAVAETLYTRSYLLGPERSLQRLSGFLRDADLLTRMLVHVYLGEESALITPENIAFHLRQPLSAFVGAVMSEGSSEDGPQVEELRGNILSEFRHLAGQHYRPGSGIDYLQQHAVHMLGRYGRRQDSEFTHRYLKSDDILARRMAMFGMALGGDPSINGALLRLVHDDPSFLQAVASFDAVHYGDAALVGGRLPQSPARLEVAISNSLAYILQDVKEENVDLNFIKITAFVRRFGPGVIKVEHRPAISGVLQAISTSRNLSQSRREFRASFQKIV